MDIETRQIILASASPRRLEILRAHGIEPVVIVPEVDEEELAASLWGGLEPQELAQQLAMEKARVVYELIRDDASGLPGSLVTQNTFILAADTIVCSKELGVLGKPTDHADAVRMLLALCNTAHEVITGVAAIELATGKRDSLADLTTVHFREYGLSEIEEYLVCEPPFDKAGSYAIQGMWSKQVGLVEGDLENVIGLPHYRLCELLNNQYCYLPAMPTKP